MAEEGSAVTYTKTTISVSGQNNLLNFDALTLSEKVLDVNSFSFTWLPDTVYSTFTDISDFKSENLSQLVTISFLDENANPNHIFRGFITQIRSGIVDGMNTSFQVMGLGVFCTIAEKTDCKSFADKKVSEILDAVNPKEATTNIKSNISSDNTHEYVVQYNQTGFDFMRMLAIRYGYWMFYDGQNLIFGDKPSSDAISMKAIEEVLNINIYASTGKANSSTSAYDVRKGEVITSTDSENAPNSSLIQTADNKSENVYKSGGNGLFIPASLSKEKLNEKNKLNQQSTIASNIFISASSHNSKLTVGSVIAITDEKDSSGQNFIIIEINHSTNNNHGYINTFTAMPFEVAVPNYTNPNFYPKATMQPAIVVDNVDSDDGLDRITVRFSWMSDSEKTPWIPVLTPHAGKNKGMRWLPEKNEEVMIDFLNNNVERPVMIGTFYTEKNKSGFSNTDNNVKALASKGSRSIMIDDGAGTFVIADFTGSNPGNEVSMKKSDSDTHLTISSGKDDQNFSAMAMANNGNLNLHVKSSGTDVLLLSFDANSKKITLKSQGSIDISADQEINMSSGTINIKASQELNLEGTATGVNIKGMKISAKADTNLEMEGTAEVKLKGAVLEVTADAMGKFDGGGVAIVKGGVVMIN